MSGVIGMTNPQTTLLKRGNRDSSFVEGGVQNLRGIFMFTICSTVQNPWIDGKPVTCDLESTGKAECTIPMEDLDSGKWEDTLKLFRAWSGGQPRN